MVYAGRGNRSPLAIMAVRFAPIFWNRPRIAAVLFRSAYKTGSRSWSVSPRFSRKGCEKNIVRRFDSPRKSLNGSCSARTAYAKSSQLGAFCICGAGRARAIEALAWGIEASDDVFLASLARKTRRHRPRTRACFISGAK